MNTKHCSECNKDLSKWSFTSTRAKYCVACSKIVKMRQINAMQSRAIEKLKNKKPKKVLVKSLPQLKKQLQQAFNSWIRNRDKDLPCISCGQFKDKYHAGHFIAQGFSGFLRYNEDNCHKQCVGCNLFKRGNLLEYRISLTQKIGKDKVEWLEEHRKDVKKTTREELEELLNKYKEQ